MSASVMAWHFCGHTLRDGRQIPRDGAWLVHDGPIVICESGLHASRRPAHALSYAPGPILCRVECADIVDEYVDKLVCRRRRIVARMDATEMLRYYARMQALSVIDLYDDPPDVVLDYLMTGDESMRDAAWAAAWDASKAAARDAAWDAARAAAWAAAWDAARDAARDAAWAAAWDASKAAARDAAWDAAWAAAWDAARDAAWAAAWDASKAAARDAAWDAARAAARDDFDALVHECFGVTP